jgi:hypothetical protein
VGERAPSRPVDVISTWASAWERGDFDAARSFIRDDAEIRACGIVVATGFQGLRAWYASNARDPVIVGQDAAIEPVEIFGGRDYAALVMRVRDAGRSWQRVAVYSLSEGQIARIDIYETPQVAW